MSESNYWLECVATSLEEHGVAATEEQIQAIAGDIEVSHECYGMAFYQPPAGEHLSAENDRLSRELKDERRKILCKECNGSGRIVSYGPIHSCESECWKCRGEGRRLP